VGSCCTLVFENCERTSFLNKQIVELLLGTILLDTINLDFSKGRGTEKDLNIVNRIRSEFGFSVEESNDIFENVQRAKYDISSLSTKDLLRKDYKEFNSPQGVYGMSTVLLSTKELTARSDFLNNVEHYYHDRNLILLVVMIAYNVGENFHRELIVYTPNSILFNSINAFLKEDRELELEDFVGLQIFNPEHFKFFIQKNSKASRKVVQPLIEQFWKL